MIRAPFASALALAALLAVPAFAQTDSNSPTVNGATIAPLEKNSAKQTAAAPAKQMKADSTTKSTTSTAADVNSSSVNGAYVAPLEKNAAKQSASSPGKQAAADGTTKSTTSTSADVNSPSVSGATVTPLTQNSAKQQAAADCADHPNAGKLVDKSTGMAKDHSASAVHEDCMTDAKPKVGKKKSTKTASSQSK
jgi:hypothetical protein